MSNLDSWLDELRARHREWSPEELAEALAGPEPPLLLDVREPDEWSTGHVPGASHLPRGLLEVRCGEILPDRARRTVLYCAGGVRSLLAVESLARLGYEDLVSLRGGVAAWSRSGGELTTPRVLDSAQRARYARHLTIPEVGEEGQARLLAGRVALVGAGGLGSPAALYLAAAGVGQLTVIDDDRVEASNLQRQVLHDTPGVGRPKTESAADRLTALNPDVTVTPVTQRLVAANVEELLGGHDVVVDGADNFSTRYLVNDACVRLGLPAVHGSVHRFEGQVTVFWAGKGPCYRCLFPEPPPPGLAPSCAEAGVLGVVPGVVGLLQAVEVVKLLLDAGDALVGRLLTYEALQPAFTELKLRRDPECSHCAEGREFPGYQDLADHCGGG
ncbi:MAG: molybdopterin-synthase adenylyltransferase MoeB [Acidobacteriota bacterium]